ncbi:hypothetical protein EYR36_003208 [Pleurotus pulmonarius]|nr:hypothetical protein EYR36_003208 [Pleurotus pulmonarius]
MRQFRAWQIQPKGFQWTNRGWTLQEYLTARRIKIIGAGLPTKKFDAIRRGTVNTTNVFKDSTLLGPLGTLGKDNHPHLNRAQPGTDKALSIFGAMRNRKITRPEEKAYRLFSTLQSEGFDMAVYRLIVACLTRTGDLSLLL